MSTLDTLPPDFDAAVADALVIAEAGACNPAGIAATLHHACRQVIHEGGRQADDPAVRLISLQLSFVTNVGRVLDPADYARLIETCRAPRGRTRPQPPRLIPHVPGPRLREAGRLGADRSGRLARGPMPRAAPPAVSTHPDSENAMLDATPAADVSARPQLPPVTPQSPAPRRPAPVRARSPPRPGPCLPVLEARPAARRGNPS